MMRSNFVYLIKQRLIERKLLLVGAIGALLLAQLMFGALVVSTLYNQFRAPITSLNSSVVESVAQNLSRMARLGKAPERVQNLNGLLLEYQGKSVAQTFLITDSKDKVIASWDNLDIGKLVPVEQEAKTVLNTVKEFSSQNMIWNYQDILDRNNQVVGRVLLGLEQKVLFQTVFKSAQSLVWSFLIISALAVLLLLVLTLANPDIKTNKSFTKMRLYFSLVFPLIFAQVCFIYTMREPIAMEQSKELLYLGTQVAERLGKDINKVVNMGVSLEDIPSVDSYTINLQSFLPLVSGIAVFDSQSKLVVATDSVQKLSLEMWNSKLHGAYQYQTYLFEGDLPNMVGTVKVLIDKKVVDENIYTITVDILTMTVVAILLLIEIVILLLLKEEQMRSKDRKALVSYPNFIRPVIFFSMVAIDIPLSFVALRMQEISPVLWDLPPDVVLSLPISSELFMVGFAIFICGFLSEKIGWQRMLIIGSAFVFVGSIAGALANGSLSFILSRAISGFGYGTINIAAQLFIINSSSAENRAANLSAMYAGLFAGSLCGIPIGGLIAERFGYTAVFYAAALVILFVGLVLLCTIFKTQEQVKVVESAEQSNNSFVWKDFLVFIFDRRIFSLLTLSILPLAFVSVCLFQYFVPIVLNASGNSPATISRVTMFFFIIVVYLGPVFAKAIDASKNKVYLLFIAGLLAACSLLSFIFLDGLVAAICSMGFLGLCNAIVSSGHAAFALEQKVASQFGTARSAAVYNLTERMGQVIGPICLGVMLTLLGTTSSLITVAIVIIVLSLIFLVTGQVKKNE